MLRLRDLYPRARRNIEARIEANVRPRIEADVVALLAPYPGPAVYPFQFATDRSRRYYFWRFKGQIPYPRSGAMAAAWMVQTTALNGNFLTRLVGFVRQQQSGGMIIITISNDDPAFIYVYQPRQVAGHRNTGWNELLESNRETVIENARLYVLQEWGPAVQDAIREG